MKAVDWLGRVLLLVLSGTATLSLIGAIVETTDMTTDTGPGSMPPARQAEPSPPPPGEVSVARAPLPSGQALEPAPLPPGRHEADRWLRTLTYAVTALAGFVAAGVVVLLRITATLDRIARR